MLSTDRKVSKYAYPATLACHSFPESLHNESEAVFAADFQNPIVAAPYQGLNYPSDLVELYCCFHRELKWKNWAVTTRVTGHVRGG